jgi:phage baseplate assembly protein W
VVTDTDFDQVFGRDCGLYAKQLAANESGDFALTSGVDNLSQQLRHGINTPRGQQTRHPQYGCLVWSLFGKVNGPTAARLGAEYVKATISADYRISKILSVVADVSGDTVAVTARAEAISGGVIDLTNQSPDMLPDAPSKDEELMMYIDLLHQFVHVTLPARIKG